MRGLMRDCANVWRDGDTVFEMRGKLRGFLGGNSGRILGFFSRAAIIYKRRFRGGFAAVSHGFDDETVSECRKVSLDVSGGLWGVFEIPPNLLGFGRRNSGRFSRFFF